METNIFSELALVIGIGTVVALFMKLLRQPLVIGYILTGIIAGPAALNIIKTPETTEVFSSIGIALLLFIIGLDLSVKVFSRVGKTVLITSAVQVSLITVVGFFISRLLGFGKLESGIIGLALAMSSTIIIIKLLNDKKETTRLYAQITIGILLIQDLIATAAKIIIAIRTGNDGSAIKVILLLVRGISITAVVYFVSRYLIPKLTHALENSKELLLLFGLGWGLGLAALFESVGFSIEIGALFAGVSLASLPYSNEMASRLKPLRDFFIVIFFITLGQTMTPSLLTGIVTTALVLAAVALVLKPIVIMATMGLIGYTKRASFKSAISMSQISEFSLVLMFAALGAGLVTQKASDTLTFVALLTFAGSTYLMKYDDELYTRFERQLRFFERKVTTLEQHEMSNHFTIALFGYRKGGIEFIKTFQSMNKRFVVVDYDPEIIEILEKQHVHYLYGDATDLELLEEMHLNKVSLVVSTVSDNKTNSFLAHWLSTNNPDAVFICSADSIEHAADLYSEGASYVILPHYIGTEKMTAFIKRNGFNKTEFKNYREKHLSTLMTKYEDEELPAEA
jgi:Kef-type K+ transport system membrane component KefB/Trk K+ transport system NAD-binding subunit